MSASNSGGGTSLPSPTYSGSGGSSINDIHVLSRFAIVDSTSDRKLAMAIIGWTLNETKHSDLFVSGQSISLND